MPRVSNSKFNLIFDKVELVTRKKNFYRHFRVSNSKCNYSFFNFELETQKLKNKSLYLKLVT